MNETRIETSISIPTGYSHFYVCNIVEGFSSDDVVR